MLQMLVRNMSKMLERKRFITVQYFVTDHYQQSLHISHDFQILSQFSTTDQRVVCVHVAPLGKALWLILCWLKRDIFLYGECLKFFTIIFTDVRR